ncbi:hypothetical protein PIB30_061561 [Stylosanthes scabra]|uniref:Uncharacterized protein n=1 Tax=Stylosanthes scabra TaxID=79078 RepID=A0ABU6VKL5_9FABA|nr:hypothetical protein [Stylosanthes scabra]
MILQDRKGERLHAVLPKSQIDEDELFDVVAMVVGKKDPKEMLTKHGKELKRLVIVLEDIEKSQGFALKAEYGKSLGKL